MTLDDTQAWLDQVAPTLDDAEQRTAGMTQYQPHGDEPSDLGYLYGDLMAEPAEGHGTSILTGAPAPAAAEPQE